MPVTRQEQSGQHGALQTTLLTDGTCLIVMCVEHRIVCFCCAKKTTATNYFKCYSKCPYLAYDSYYYEEKNNANHVVTIKIIESLFSCCLKCKSCTANCGSKKVKEIEYNVRIKNYKKPKICRQQKMCFIC